MRRILIRAIPLFFFILVSAMPLAAQISLVLDQANLLQSIDTLYATYDHITQTIEQVKNTYEQLQRQIAMVQNMDFNNIAESFKNMDPSSLEGILAMRGQIKDVYTYVNRNMNLINAVEDTLTKKTINFGGKNYTFGGLFGFGNSSPGTTIFDLPMNVLDYVEETADQVTAGYEGRLSYRQKEVLMSRYGLSPRNYAKLRLVEEVTANLIDQLLMSGTNEHTQALLEEAHANQVAIDDLSQAAGESMVAQQQATVQALLNIATAETRLEIGINNLSSYIATQDLLEAQRAELEAQQREIEAMRRENERRKLIAPADWELY